MSQGNGAMVAAIMRHGRIALCWAAAMAAAWGGDARVAAIRSDEPGWPQFRGPGRDGICEASGLLRTWPEDGPNERWRIGNIGRGYSSPIFVEDTFYITGDVGENLVIFAFDLDGQLKWKTANGRFWEHPFPGARASCTYDDGRLYHMNAHGRVACLDPKDGRELWAVDILERFDAENIRWGLSECVLVDGGRVIVTPGGPECLMAALDKKTGETVWTTEPLRFLRTEHPGAKPVDAPFQDHDRAGYASPILFEFGSRRLIAGCSARYVFLVDAGKGKLLATSPVEPARWEVIGTMPLAWRDSVVFSAPDFGTKRYRIVFDGNRCRLDQIWEAEIDNCHGAFVALDDRLYGSGYRRARGWMCTDLETGQALYTHPDLTKGAPLFADNRIYALAEDGTIALLEPTPSGFQTHGRFEVPRGTLRKGKRRRDVWAHPVIYQGRLHLRDHDVLACYDLRPR